MARAMNDSVFTKYVADIPEPERPVEPGRILRGPLVQPVVPPTDRKSSPAERLLDWLINAWDKPTVSARDICWRGPTVVRNRQSVIDLAGVLVAAGWLAPIKSRRRDMREWRIARGPGG